MTTTNNTSSTTDTSSQFALQRIYALVSSEVPEIPVVFELNEAPHLDVKLNVQTKAITSKIGDYAVELTVIVTAMHEEKTVFLIEVKQGGIFVVQGFDEATLKQILNVQCATILYPYASAVVSDLVLRAGFMPLHLPPVDFNAMNQQKAEE